MHKPIRSGAQLSVPERDSCARAVQAFARPYAARIAGTPLKSEFILDRVEFVSDPTKSNEAAMHPTEVFVLQLLPQRLLSRDVRWTILRPVALWLGHSELSA
ncbi:hypothetical protein PC128_g19895 [Phytophthora cactorum]|nr:hypothetical protein PC120_g26066 [Phytophthora cactorum]KAG3051118.1 hypothetical protein PC121_g18033 [Phytophthora cactorum]KAG3165567.1 hypothetical protein PC128_g19895 [Phytophthora cactorum]